MKKRTTNINFNKLAPCLAFYALTLISSCINKTDNIELDSLNNYDIFGQQQLSKNSGLILIIPDTQIYVTQIRYRRNLNQVIERINEIDVMGYKIKAVLQVGDI